jgi:hypothetical protein
MPKTLADGRLALIAFTTKPTGDLEALTATVINAARAAGDLSCRVLKSDYRLSATGSDTVADTELCSTGNAVTYGASNYEGTVTPFRYLTPAGLADAANDIAWDLLKEKGTTLWLLEREGPEYNAEFAVGQEYDLYEVVTDEPQKPGDRTGFIKRVVPLGVQRHYRGVVAAGA